jgi:hypothetical protein
MDPARRHALVRRLDHHGNTAGFEHLIDHLRDLRRHSFLDLQPLGEHPDEPREL